MSGEKFDNGYVRDSSNRILGKVDGNYVRDSSNRIVGKVDGDNVRDSSNRIVGKIRDFTIRGIEREKDETIVAVYNFLVKKIF